MNIEQVNREISESKIFNAVGAVVSRRARPDGHADFSGVVMTKDWEPAGVGVRMSAL